MRAISAVGLFAARNKVGKVAFFDLALEIYCLLPLWSWGKTPFGSWLLGEQD